MLRDREKGKKDDRYGNRKFARSEGLDVNKHLKTISIQTTLCAVIFLYLPTHNPFWLGET